MSSGCLFCRLYAEGEHVRKAADFVAVKDINPRAETLFSSFPSDMETFRDVGEFPDDEAKRMLEFVAETASWARGLPRRRQRRLGRRTDDFSPALASADAGNARMSLIAHRG